MDMNFTYAPVIKGKLNDIKAVSYLAHEFADQIKPIFELPPFVETDKPEEVLSRFALRLGKLYAKRACFVDFPLLKAGSKTSDGHNTLSVAYAQLNILGVNFEPVYGFGRDDSQWKVVIEQAIRSGGMLLRLEPDDMEFANDTLDRIQELSLRGLSTRQMDVLLDCRYLPGGNSTSNISATASEFLEQLSAAFHIRRLIVAGSSAPKTVGEISKNSRGDIFRNELTLWTNLRLRNLPLDAIYGDYGIIHPDFTDLTPSSNINGKIRYTQGKHIHIFRGYSLRQGEKYEQYRTLSHNVLKSGFFQGPTFSHGDRYIYDCATGHATTGNPGTWVMNDQNHHFTYTVQQINRLESLIYRGYTQDAILEMA